MKNLQKHGTNKSKSEMGLFCISKLIKLSTILTELMYYNHNKIFKIYNKNYIIFNMDNLVVAVKCHHNAYDIYTFCEFIILFTCI